MEPSYDVLVVGAGCAGMRAAIEAHDRGARVAVVSKLHPTRSHSGAAEGGINAALGNKAEDSPEKHAFDTVKGSDYLGDQDAIEIFTAEAPGDIYQLEHWGAVFSREQIMAAAYQLNIQVSDRTIDSHIRNIRAKLAALNCDNAIETIHGVGFKLGRCEPQS